jgi:hypothetical protein
MFYTVGGGFSVLRDVSPKSKDIRFGERSNRGPNVAARLCAIDRLAALCLLKTFFNMDRQGAALVIGPAFLRICASRARRNTSSAFV